MVTPRRRSSGPCLLALALAALAGVAIPADGQTRRPNVVVILADDLGWADVSLYAGGRIPTPNLERLAAGGVRFTHGYVTAPVCSPSRAALLTGRYQQRYGHEFNNGPARRDLELGLGLPAGERTLADLLGAQGYETGMVGKWHLGARPEFQPTVRGFEQFFGILPGGTAYIDPERPDVESASLVAEHFKSGRVLDDPTTRRELVQVVRATRGGGAPEPVANFDRYLTEVFTEEAVRFIEQSAGGERPFFLYLAHTAPHSPLQVTRTYYDRFPQLADRRQRVYAAMVSALDDGVGVVLDRLDSLGIANDTVVVFLSDNGCATYTGACACEPLNGGKVTFLEGGVRVPFVLRWPARVPAGGVFEHPVSSLDVLPTALAAAAAALPSDRPYDGVDLVPYLRGERAGTPHPLLFWRNGPQVAALRSVDPLGTGQRIDKLWVSRAEPIDFLFEHRADPGERRNLAGEQPARRAELLRLIEEWEQQLVAPLWTTRGAVPLEVCGAVYQIYP